MGAYKVGTTLHFVRITIGRSGMNSMIPGSAKSVKARSIQKQRMCCSIRRKKAENDEKWDC